MEFSPIPRGGPQTTGLSWRMSACEFGDPNAPHRCSIRFSLGDCAGHFITLTLFSLKQFFTNFDVCFGSLSCIKIQSDASLSCACGSIFCSKMSLYICAFIGSSILTNGLTPSLGKQPEKGNPWM